MSGFHTWILLWAIRIIIRNRAEIYLFRLLREENARQWYEDNWPTRESRLQELFNQSSDQTQQDRPYWSLEMLDKLRNQ